MHLRCFTRLGIASIATLVAPSLSATPLTDGLEAFKEGRFDEASTLWARGASLGDVDAELQLGVMLGAGKHLPRDVPRARALLAAAVQQGNVDAMVALALLDYRPDVGQREEGLALLKSAAARSSRKAPPLLTLAGTVDLATLGFSGPASEQEALLPVRFSKPFSANPADVSAGRDTVNRTCVACHGTGVMGAPRSGHPEQWKERLSLGLDTLAERSAKGYKACPPRGGDYLLTDDQVRAAVYVMTEGGARR